MRIGSYLIKSKQNNLSDSFLCRHYYAPDLLMSGIAERIKTIYRTHLNNETDDKG